MCPPHLNNVLTLPCSTEAVTFHTYNALLEYDTLLKHDVKHEIHQVGLQKNKLIVTRCVRNVCHWLEHKRASVLATGQLHHQSATAQGHATHAADAVVAHQCHVLWFHTHILNDRPNGIIHWIEV